MFVPPGTIGDREAGCPVSGKPTPVARTPEPEFWPLDVGAGWPFYGHHDEWAARPRGNGGGMRKSCCFRGRRAGLALATLFAVTVAPGLAEADLTPGPSDVYVRIVDTGPGLCVVATVPGGHELVYDAGHWVGKHCRDAVRELVTDKTIDVLVLSHADADHLGQAADILDEFKVRTIIRTGENSRPNVTQTWRRVNERIGKAATNNATVINLQTSDLVPGTTLALGEATLTLIAGWGQWTESGPTASEKLNAISIVVKLEYRGRSVLFTGDTVGRRLNDPDNACKDAEHVMVSRHHAGDVSLKSDVLIAPHHGGNNGSSASFIKAVDPLYVVFPAGHGHNHPSNGAAQRYITRGVPLDRILRTDRGDDEGGYEWNVGAVPGCQDRPGDDDVEIAIRDLRFYGWVDVSYRKQRGGC